RNGGHTGRNGHGDGEDVIDQQRGGGHQARNRPKIVMGDDVRSAAVRISVDRLLIRNRHDDEQAGDRHRDGVGQMRGGSPREHEDEKNFFGRIGHRRQRVRRKDGQRDGLAETLVAGLSQGHWSTDEHAFEKADPHVTRLYSAGARSTESRESFYGFFTRSPAILSRG